MEMGIRKVASQKEGERRTFCWVCSRVLYWSIMPWMSESSFSLKQVVLWIGILAI